MQYILHRSWFYTAVQILLHLLATTMLFWTDMAPAWRYFFVFLLCLSLFFSLRASRPWRSFFLDQDRIVVTLSDGKAVSGELSGRTLITPLCVVLRARLDGQLIHQVIFKDAMPADAFRDLRVRLKFS